jgi:hypothetical protein
MLRRVCRATFTTGGVSALSGTADLPAVRHLLDAVGPVTARRASDVLPGPGGWAVTVRAWVSGAPVYLGMFSTKSEAVEREVTYLAARGPRRQEPHT